MAMVNQVIPPQVLPSQVKDSRWLTLEVCREYTRNKCTRSDQECKFAHPPPHVEVQNGRVTCCFDSIKGKCQRKDPPCKYLHPPQHLKEQLLQNGRNNLILRQLQMQALTQSLPMAPMYPMASAGAMPASNKGAALSPYPSSTSSMLAASPGGHFHHPFMQAHPSFMVQNPGFGQYVPVLNNIHGMLQATALDGTAAGVPQSTSSASNGGEGWIQGGSPGATDAPPTTQCSPIYFQPQPVVEVLNAVQGKKRARDPNDDLLLGTVPGNMMPMVKRSALADTKSGMPIGYPAAQQSSSSYQQAALAAMQLQQQQPFVPVTMSMLSAQSPSTPSSSGPSNGASSLAAAPSSVNYFDEANQLLDTLPVCRDFKAGQCTRPQCKYVHLVEEYVDVSDGRVTVCRDAVKGKCARPMCKYYHLPIIPHLLTV